MSFTTKSRCEWFKSCIKPTHSFFLSILFISKEVPRALFQGAEVIEKQVEKEGKIPLKAASKLHLFSFLSFQRGGWWAPAEIHSSYHLGGLRNSNWKSLLPELTASHHWHWRSSAFFFAKENVKPANRRHILALSLPFGQLSMGCFILSILGLGKLASLHSF